MTIENEKAIRAIVSGTIGAYAAAFSEGHLFDTDEGNAFNLNVRDVLTLAIEMQSHSPFKYSLGSSIKHLLKIVATNIATLFYEEFESTESNDFQAQTDYICELLICYEHSANKQIHTQSDSRLWNTICKSERGCEIVLDELNKNLHWLKPVFQNYKKQPV